MLIEINEAYRFNEFFDELQTANDSTSTFNDFETPTKDGAKCVIWFVQNENIRFASHK